MPETHKGGGAGWLSTRGLPATPYRSRREERTPLRRGGGEAGFLLYAASWKPGEALSGMEPPLSEIGGNQHWGFATVEKFVT